MSSIRNAHIPLEERPTVVYRAYSETGMLLYVGITHHFGNRMRGHRKQSAWYKFAKTARVETYENRALALAVESWAITYENPPWNTDAQWHFVPFILPTPTKVETKPLWQEPEFSFD